MVAPAGRQCDGRTYRYMAGRNPFLLLSRVPSAPACAMPTPPEQPSLVAERRFFAVMAVAAAVVVFAGFATNYYLWPLTRATHFGSGQLVSRSLPLVVHSHAVLFTLWMGLFVVQSVLVDRGRVAAHRRLGQLGACLVPAMVLTGLMTAVRGARDGWNPGGPFPDALGFMIVGVFDILVFTVLTIAGLIWRRRPDLHRRLMLLGTIGGLMWPAITRIPFLAGRLPLMYGLLAALALAPAVRDFATRSRLRWLSIGVGVAILASLPIRAAVGNSAAWREFAAWLIR